MEGNLEVLRRWTWGLGLHIWFSSWTALTLNMNLWPKRQKPLTQRQSVTFKKALILRYWYFVQICLCFVMALTDNFWFALWRSKGLDGNTIIDCNREDSRLWSSLSIDLFIGPRKGNTHSRETNKFVDNNYHYKERNVKLSTFRTVGFPFMH